MREIKLIDLDEIKSAEVNPKRHDIDSIKQSVVRQGFVELPVVDGRTGRLVAGHGRIESLVSLRDSGAKPPDGVVIQNKKWMAPVVAGWSSKNDAEASAYLVASNRLTELGGWDEKQLSELMSSLSEIPNGLDGTGYTQTDVDKFIAEMNSATGVDAEPQVSRSKELMKEWNVKAGQMWELGKHRLLCGDCTKREDVDRVLMGEKAAVCLTDPPYGLGSKKESGKNSYDDYSDTRANLEELASKWLPIARDVAPVVCFSPGVTNSWIYPEATWVMCWFYGGGQLRSSWGFNCWQPFLCYGKDPSLASGNGGRPDAINLNTPSNSGELDHPCPKPVNLWTWFIERLSFSMGEVFYEPFSGSGTTIIACEQLGRACRAIELSPAYVAVALQRFKDATGKTPKLIEGK